MHEFKIAADILEKAGNAKKIKVLVGEISGIHGHDLQPLLEKRVEVEFEQEKAEVECECGFKGYPKILLNEHENVLIECPSCGRVPKIIKGGEIILKEICV